MAENGNRRPNEMLRHQRQLRGWTLDDVAERLHRMVEHAGGVELGVDAHMVGRWERGVRHPAPRYVSLLCRLFELPADELGLVPGEAPPERREDDLQRRQFLQYLGLVGGATVLDWDRLSALVHGQAEAADEPLLADLEALTTSYARQVESMAPMSLLPALRSHLGVLTRALRAVPPPEIHRRLLSLTGETAAMDGLLSYLVDNRGDARSSWAYALELAREADDDTLLAFTLTMQRLLHSTIPSRGRFGNTARALALLDQAAARLDGRSRPHMRAMVLAKRAEEHAAAGDELATGRDLGEAERLLANAPPHDGFFAGWDEVRMAGYRGSCALALWQPREAAAVLEGAMKRTKASLVGQRCAVVTDLAAAYAQEGDVDRACHLLTESLDDAERSGLEELVLRASGAREHLSRWRDSPAVKRLDERFAAHV
jgi:transcriptional regulator with XRE-family HTH domain